MSTLIAFPLLFILVVVQSSLLSRITLLQGSADIILLVLISWAIQEKAKDAWIWAVIAGSLISFLSVLPFPLLLAAYLLIVIGIRLVIRRLWQVPIIMVLIGTTLGTITILGLQLLSRVSTGVRLPFGESISLVILPSILLNLLFSIPVYTLVTDLARLVLPKEKEM